MAVLLGEPATAIHTPQAHRADVLERLLAQGIPLRTLEALLPGWTAMTAQATPATPA